VLSVESCLLVRQGIRNLNSTGSPSQKRTFAICERGLRTLIGAIRERIEATAAKPRGGEQEMLG
jgi:hypothetical protein